MSIGFYAAGAMGSSGGGGSVFPEVLSATVQNFDSNTTDHNINLPAAVSSGDLLVVVGAIFMFSAESISSVSAGWTLHAQNWVNSPNTRSFVLSRIADGSEGGGVVNVVSSVARVGAAFVYRIKSGTYHGDIEWNLTATATTDTFPVAALSPSWGVGKTLWIANFVKSANSGAITLPYPDNQFFRGSGSSTMTRYGACTVNSESSSRPSGNFVTGISAVHGVNTIAIRPA